MQLGKVRTSHDVTHMMSNWFVQADQISLVPGRLTVQLQMQ